MTKVGWGMVLCGNLFTFMTVIDKKKKNLMLKALSAKLGKEIFELSHNLNVEQPKAKII